MIHWAWLIPAVIGGGSIGMFVTALLVASGRNTDNYEQRVWPEDHEEENA